MDKLAYDKLLCELTGLSGPMGFVGAPGNPALSLEVWKLPNGQIVHLWPSDMLTDAQRKSQMAELLSACRSD